MKKQKQNRFTSMTYKEGRERQEQISSKISELIKEGKTQEQAIAMALNMFQQGGGVNMGINQNKRQADLNLKNPELSEYYSATVVKDPNKVPTFVVDGVEYEVSRLGALRKKGTLEPTPFGAIKKGAVANKEDAFQQGTAEVGQNKLNPERSVQSLFELNRGWILDDQGKRIRKVEIPGVENFYQLGGQQPTAGYYFGNTNPYPFSGDMYKQYQFPESVTTPTPTQSDFNTWNKAFEGQNQNMTPRPSQEDFNMWNKAFEGQNTFQNPNVTFQDNIGFNQGEQYLGLGKDPNFKSQLSVNTTPNTSTPNLQLNQQDSYQFFNPYGGVDLEASTQYLGQSIGSGDTLGIVAGGLKTLTGAARNIFGGIGAANRKEEAMKNYYENQREAIVGKPQYMQEGGEQQGNPEEILMQVAQLIQSGVDPQEVFQQLVASGLTEQEASQLIQMVMEQVQGQQMPPQEQPIMREGGEYLSMLKGKRIKDYQLNSETGNYEITYE